MSANTGWALSDTEILKAAAGAHPRFFLGTRAGKASRYAVLDIDANSKYHCSKHLKKLLSIFAEAGISKNVLYRSSRSGGWHLYFFFAEPICSRDLQNQFHRLLSSMGFEIAKGQLEVFPNPGQYGSLGCGLRLPLQHGFAWLDKETQQVQWERDEMYALEAMGMFTADFHEHQTSYADYQRFKNFVEDLEKRKSDISFPQQKSRTPATVVSITSKKPIPAGEEITAAKTAFLGTLPPGINTKTWLAGRAFYDSGLTAPGQRAEAIFSLSHYLFYGDPERGLNALGYGYENERQWLIEKMLATKHNDKSEDINKGRTDAFEQIERATHWLPPQRRESPPEKFKRSANIVWIRANAKRKSQARKKISTALEQMKTSGKKFAVRDLQKLSGCSTDTLYNHQDIWRQDYEDLADGFFASVPGEYNAVVVGDCSETPLPSTSDQKNVPLGLMAARQLAYEISMRAQREKKKQSRKDAQEKERVEENWKFQVFSALQEALDPTKTIAQLKTLLAFLIFLLLSAPSEDELIVLQAQISQLKSRLLRLTAESKLTLVGTGRPPPAD